MKFYLSSFKIGNKPDELIRLIYGTKKLSKKKKIAYIPNACDFTNTNIEKIRKVRLRIGIV